MGLLGGHACALFERGSQRLIRPRLLTLLQAVLAFIENGMLPTLLPLSLKPFQHSEVLISVANKGERVCVVLLACPALSLTHAGLCRSD